MKESPKKPVKKLVKKVTKKTVKKRVVRKVVKFRRPKKIVKKVLRRKSPTVFKRHNGNPIIDPDYNSYWESEAVFNPGVVVSGERVHLFYRALGRDGVSRIGYASSGDGVHFDKRLAYPVYSLEYEPLIVGKQSLALPSEKVYDRNLYVSGGGWGGSEDPRAVKIDGRVYVTFNVFNDWHSIRIALISIDERDLNEGRFHFRRLIYLSQPNERHKNWVLFPEKIDGKYALLHNIYNNDHARVQIKYLDEVETSEPIPSFNSPDPHLLPNREIAWHNRTRSVGPPPVKTDNGWLVFYHAMDTNDPGRYKLGAMLLDLDDPTKIIYRSAYPVLEPDAWYENDWKPGIIYVTGAVVKDDTLFLYYGGGDKHVAVAHTNLNDFLRKLMNKQHAVF